MADEVLSRERYGEAFWRAHHVVATESTRVLRGSGHPAQGVRQLAGEVQGRAPTVGAQAALSTRRVKSHP
jgi:hypothetical protein